MRVFSRTIILMLLFEATLTAGIAADAPQSGQNASPPFDHGSDSNRSPVNAQEKITGLKMSIRASAPENTDSLRLHVTFENVSDKDTVLNLGMMLANGKVHLPDAVRLILTDANGQSRELHFSEKRYPGIAGPAPTAKRNCSTRAKRSDFSNRLAAHYAETGAFGC